MTLKARDRAEKETGERKFYMPNVTSEANEMIRRAEFVKSAGGEYAMVDIITTGFSALQTLRQAELGLVIHAHRAMHAALTRSDSHEYPCSQSRNLAASQESTSCIIGAIVGRCTAQEKR